MLMWPNLKTEHIQISKSVADIQPVVDGIEFLHQWIL